MIIRVFRPTVRPGQADSFERFLRETAVPMIASQEGMLAQHVGVPMDTDSRDFVYISLWKDVESIRGFAGEKWQEAVIDPSEAEMLETTSISHYEVLDSD